VFDGLSSIETIKAGDYILSTDPDTMKTDYKLVLETYIRKVDRLVHLIISGEEIITTVDHPFYVQGRGFIQAGSLLVGDKLVSVNGEDLLIENYNVELIDELVPVYNFQVEDFHTYHVGENGVLVHNASGYCYNNDPMQDPKAARDIVEDPDAVYGYSPDPKSPRLGRFADKIDWSDVDQVEVVRQTRLEYHLENEANLQSMYDQGMTPKQIAESMVNERNINRINSYLNRGDLEGLEIMKQSNLKIYGNENGMTIQQALEKYGSYEEIINASIRSNPGMDACCGLYDDYH
jgi:hypothetical protein